MSIGMWWQDTAIVETFAGVNAEGETFADPVTIACFIDDSTELARNTKGEEVISQTVIYTDASQATVLVPDSRVTINGRVARVITLNAYATATYGLPAHVEARLT